MDEAAGMFEVIKVSTINTELWQSLCMYGKYFLSWSSHLETCHYYEVASQPAETLHPVPVHNAL